MAENNIDLCETHIIGPETREWLVSPGVCPSLLLYGIELTGITHADDNFCFIRRAPSMSQLLVCFAGSGLVLVDGDWRDCGSGSAYLTPSGAPHAYRAVAGAGWKLCWVMYTADKPHSPPIGLDKPALLQVDTHALTAAIEGLHRESMGLAVPAIMHHWASLLHAHAERVILPPARLHAVWEAVRADLAYPWTVEELAAIVKVSPEHLRRLSLTEVNRSPLRHVTELRMSQATALLASESYTIEEVAGRVGYDNPFAFSTAFKRCVGTPPSRFRETRYR